MKIVTKKRLKITALALAGLALVLCVVALNPAFQRWVALGQLEKFAPGAELDRLAAGPFSTEIRGLKLAVGDARLELAALDAEYSPWGLLLKKINIRRLHVAGAVVEWTPAETEAEAEAEEAVREALPGIWELTDAGWRLSLDDVAVEARLKVPAAEVSLAMAGGGLAPMSTGVFHVDALRLTREADADAIRQVDVSGTVRLTESTRGALTALEWDLRMEAVGPLFDNPPRLRIGGEWVADTAWAEASRAEAAAAPYPAESFSFKIEKIEADRQRSGDDLVFEAGGVYDAEGERAETRFTLAADNAALAPFAWALDLPEFDGRGDGQAEWDFATMTGGAAMKVAIDFSKLERLSSALQGVGKLRIEEEHRVTVKADHAVLERLALRITHLDGDEVIALETSHPLTFSRSMIEGTDSGEHGFERPWLSLIAEIPLEWLDPVLGGFQLAGADLRGRLNFTGNPLRHLVIAPEGPFAAEGTTLGRDGVRILEDVAVTLSPRLELGPDEMALNLDEFHIGARGHDLLQGDLTAGLVLGTAEGFHAHIEARMEAFVQGLVSQEMEGLLTEEAAAVQERVIALAKALGQASLKLSLAAAADPDAITAEHLSAQLISAEGGTFIQANLLKPVKMRIGDAGIGFDGVEGTWLEAVSRDFPVNALGVFTDEYNIEGGVIQGGFTLAAGAEPGSFVIVSAEALSVTELSLGPVKGGPWMERVDVRVRPALDYSPGRALVGLTDFHASREGDVLAMGGLSAEVVLRGFEPESVAFTLEGEAALVPLFKQPALAPFLRQPWEQATVAKLAARGRTDFERADFSELSLSLAAAGGGSLAAFALTEPLGVKRFDIADMETALAELEGAGSFALDAFPLRLPLALVDTAPLDIAAGDATGEFAWTVDRGAFSVTPAKTLALREMSFSLDDRPLLEAITLAGEPALELSADEATARFDSIDLRTREGGPLTGSAGVVFQLRDNPALDLFDASLEGEVVPWFGQPFMPENHVTGGRLQMTAEMDPAGRVAAHLQLDDFAFHGEPPALPMASVEATATRGGADDEAWPGQIMIELDTAGGRSDLAADFVWRNRDERPLLTIDAAGERLYAGDLERLARQFAQAQTTAAPPPAEPDTPTPETVPAREQTAVAVSRRGRGARQARTTSAEDADAHDTEPEWEEPPEEVNFQALARAAEEPDVEVFDDMPFWLGLPADLDVTFQVDEVIYTNYLKVTDVAGAVAAHPERMGLERFMARFHEAEIVAAGTLDWVAENQLKPYELALNFDVSDFDLNTFFTEWVPGEKARVEGLFRMAVHADGQFPALESAHNFIRFAFDLESREGVFRAIPPNSRLGRESSDAAANVGAVLSWTPTGALGLGALSRLVSAMREIPYNRVALKITRGTDLNIRIDEMEMRSPEILFQGQGGILHAEGVDLLQQRMDLTAEMDARGNMAGILSGLGLLRGERLESGYWPGFRFRIWGDMEEPKSNFTQIVTEAATGTLTRNVTNPFLGIWSNIKFRGTEAAD